MRRLLRFFFFLFFLLSITPSSFSADPSPDQRKENEERASKFDREAAEFHERAGFLNGDAMKASGLTAGHLDSLAETYDQVADLKAKLADALRSGDERRKTTLEDQVAAVSEKIKHLTRSLKDLGYDEPAKFEQRQVSKTTKHQPHLPPSKKKPDDIITESPEEFQKELDQLNIPKEDQNNVKKKP
jgi:hypothetical protein